MSDADPCDGCGSHVSGALARTVRITVDGSEVDSQRLCPNCFAGWIERYRTEMTSGRSGDDESGIIVD
ncbi:DUF7569 family protein [Halogeometricum limi]|uniref:Small CPxCG-related zinc finger protein n=1 Tax=Halogeometricum limi TaxID=555875 RepID=A0A1I6FQ88_9EURY|nr:hypothetical protein [Halogeometricum limi]SFR32054.1 hypothetical protein SAMN04488124_0052 [Halogeometricum limi]